MIKANSRYAANPVSVTTGEDGKTRRVIVQRAPESFAATIQDYVWEDGDHLDELAYFAYGEPELWWKIAEINPEIMDWAEVPIGTAIRIPVG